MKSSSPTSSLVSARALGRRFGRQWALAHLDLEVAAGEVVLLAGPNGSGKTTFLRLVAGLYQPTSGTVRVGGEDPRRDSVSCRGRLTMVSHHAFLYERLTALETVRLWAQLSQRETTEDELVRLLGEVGLEAARDKQVGGFSAGMRKRLTLLRTRLENPVLVLWDEPFSSLDSAGRELLREWIVDFRERGVTMLLATHDLDVAAELCDRAVVLRSGQKVWTGPPERAGRQIEAMR